MGNYSKLKIFDNLNEKLMFYRRFFSFLEFYTYKMKTSASIITVFLNYVLIVTIHITGFSFKHNLGFWRSIILAVFFKMITCSDCEKEFHELSVYHKHCVDEHGRSEGFTCAQEGCQRIYDSFKSFSAHFRKNHHSDLSSQPPNLIPTAQSSKSFERSTPFREKDSTNEDVAKNIYLLLFQFCATLYSKNIASSIVQIVMQMLQKIVDNIIILVKNEVKKSLLEHGVPAEIIEESFFVIQNVRKPFQLFSTEHRRLKELKKLNFVQPEVIIVGDEGVPQTRGPKITIKSSPLTGQYIPLKKTITNFFSLPGVLKMVIANTRKEESSVDILTNYVNGQSWRKKREQDFYKDKTVIPFFLYFDEFNVNNPLGSHKNTKGISATYVSFPTLPEKFRSRVQNTFLVYLFHTNDVNDNKVAFKKLVDEVNEIQRNGLEFDVDGHAETVFFVLGLITGDNKGIHKIFGLSDFAGTYNCRFCKGLKFDNKIDTEVRADILRKQAEYEEDVSAGPSNSGVKEHSIWNQIAFFHIYTNFFVDIMHDLYEGVLKYSMGHMLYYFIFTKGYFTLELLNERISLFNYQFFSIKNKPPLITLEHVKNKKLSMSASELYTFVKLFAFYIKENIPSSDIVWKFYILTREILKVICSPVLTKDLIQKLPNLLKKHHQSYQNLFQDTLKPKFHHMLHYLMCILESGPLKYLSSMRGEAKHQTMKNIAKSTRSRKNILYTIAMREQINLSFRFNSIHFLEDNIDYGRCSNFENLYYERSMVDKIPSKFLESCIETEWVKINGVEYKIGSFILYDVPYGQLPLFGIIEVILLNEDRFSIVFRFLETVCFNEEIFAYEIIDGTSFEFCNINELYRQETFIATEMTDGKAYILSENLL